MRRLLALPLVFALIAADAPPAPVAAPAPETQALPAIASWPNAAPMSEADRIALGAKVVQERCSSCHATRKDDASPNPSAPPLRTLSRKYPIDDLAETFAEGSLVGHEMPIFAFGPKKLDALLAYLKSIQEEAPPAADAPTK